MKPTPGPWKIEGKRLITTSAIVISSDDSLGPIAVATEANAPLIVLSPEMAGLLKEIDEYLSPNPQNYIGCRSILHSKIISLLAKIDGGE